MKIRNKLPKGSIILFLVVMLLDLCVLMIISNYLEVSYLTEKVRLIYGEITVSFFISFIGLLVGLDGTGSPSSLLLFSCKI